MVKILLKKGANIQENSEYNEEMLTMVLNRIKKIKQHVTSDIELSILKMAA